MTPQRAVTGMDKSTEATLSAAKAYAVTRVTAQNGERCDPRRPYHFHSDTHRQDDEQGGLRLHLACRYDRQHGNGEHPHDRTVAYHGGGHRARMVAPDRLEGLRRRPAKGVAVLGDERGIDRVHARHAEARQRPRSRIQDDEACGPVAREDEYRTLREQGMRQRQEHEADRRMEQRPDLRERRMLYAESQPGSEPAQPQGERQRREDPCDDGSDGCRHEVAARHGNRADRSDLEEAARRDPGDLERRPSDTSHGGGLQHEEVMEKHAADEEQDDGPRIAGFGHVNLKELADRQNGEESGGRCKSRGRDARQEYEYALVDAGGRPLDPRPRRGSSSSSWPSMCSRSRPSSGTV